MRSRTQQKHFKKQRLEFLEASPQKCCRSGRGALDKRIDSDESGAHIWGGCARFSRRRRRRRFEGVRSTASGTEEKETRAMVRSGQATRSAISTPWVCCKMTKETRYSGESLLATSRLAGRYSASNKLHDAAAGGTRRLTEVIPESRH